jgi:hypothetical protein
MATTEQEIEHLKKILYSMDTLTEEENIKAKKILATKIQGKVSTIERLKIMIKIKAQIVGVKKRKFHVSGGLLLENKVISQNEVFSQLIDGNVHLSGGINAILKPTYNYFDNDIIDDYYEEHGLTMGYWTISKNFKELRYNHCSDKNWNKDRSYFAKSD